MAGRDDKPRYEPTNVVDLDSFKATLRRGTRYGADKPCKHLRVTIDVDAGLVECDDCGKSPSAFTILINLTEQWVSIAREVQQEKLRAWSMRKMLSGYKVRLRALKAIEKRWWRGEMLPTCPHCSRGLMLEDFDNVGSCSREYELERRKRDKPKAWR